MTVWNCRSEAHLGALVLILSVLLGCTLGLGVAIGRATAPVVTVERWVEPEQEELLREMGERAERLDARLEEIEAMWSAMP